MKLLQQIKNDKAQIEETRNLVKIHLSWAAHRGMMRKGPSSDYDEETSDFQNTLLGCQFEIHLHQVDDYWFEDVNGQRICGSMPWL